MSWAKEVKKICQDIGVDYEGNNSEGFAPAASREPHLHCGSDHITFTSVGHSHRGLADGNSLRRGVTTEIRDELDEGDLKRVVQKLLDTF